MVLVQWVVRYSALVRWQLRGVSGRERCIRTIFCFCCLKNTVICFLFLPFLISWGCYFASKTNVALMGRRILWRAGQLCFSFHSSVSVVPQLFVAPVPRLCPSAPLSATGRYLGVAAWCSEIWRIPWNILHCVAEKTVKPNVTDQITCWKSQNRRCWGTFPRFLYDFLYVRCQLTGTPGVSRTKSTTAQEA